jgi:thiol-disulfide isomerase/thioredoxin
MNRLNLVHLRHAATMSLLAAVQFCVVTAAAQTAEELLTLGKTAPKFEPTSFVQGEPLDKLLPETMYVIEFSGTECKPCIKAIPLMQELQAKFQHAVFVTVFSEPAEDVRQFLEGPGKLMTGRIALDEDGSIGNAWSLAAGQIGIPHIFVIDKQSKIAWIGDPNELESALDRIMADQHDYHVDAIELMKREIAKASTIKRRQIAQREQVAAQLNNEQVTELIQSGHFEQASELLTDAMDQYADLPVYGALRARKLFVLGHIPNSQDAAYCLARDILVDAQLAGGVVQMGSCHSLLNHFESASPENRDERMVQLVFAFLNGVEIAEPVSQQAVQRHEIYARAHELLGDLKAAQSELKKAIEIVKELFVRRGNEAKGGEAASWTESKLEHLRAQLERIEHK